MATKDDADSVEKSTKLSEKSAKVAEKTVKSPTAAKAKAPKKSDATQTKASTTKATATKASATKASATKASATELAKTAKARSVKAVSEQEQRPQVLKAHHLRPALGAKKSKTRLGRGEGSKGKTAGRGTKGTKARNTVRIGFEGGQMPLHMRTPKLRGFKNPFRVEYQVVNLSKLEQLYPQGGDVTVTDLVAKGLVRKNEKVKVLGDGDISVKLNVDVDKVSRSAEQKILAVGGKIS